MNAEPLGYKPTEAQQVSNNLLAHLLPRTDTRARGFTPTDS
jgi:hypothetical protein